MNFAFNSGAAACASLACQINKSPEGRAFHMRRGGAVGDVAQGVSQSGQVMDLPIDRVGFLVQHVTRQVRQPVHAEPPRSRPTWS